MSGDESTHASHARQPGGSRTAEQGKPSDEGYPPPMLELDRQCQRALEKMGVRPGRLLVAVSGGRDSVVLLDVLGRLAPELGLELVVGHVHHGLRGVEADADAAHVAELAHARDLPFVSRQVDVEAERAEHVSRTRPTIEEAARDLRRAALLEMADEAGCTSIATAHHAGDQAETVLMRLLRGTGPDGLGGIAPKSDDGRRLRPLLYVLPGEIADWASAHELVWREDASNKDPRFTRNQLRHSLLPMLAETFNPQVLRTLSNLAEAQRRDSEWIESGVEEAAQERLEVFEWGIRFAIEGWDALPEALSRRLIRRALVSAGLGRDISRAHLSRVLGVMVQGRAVGRDRRWQLPGGYSLRRVDEHFELMRETAQTGIDTNEDATVER